MLVDMHLHESTCSSDSKMTLEEIVATGCLVVARLVVLRYLTTLPQPLSNLLVELIAVGNDDHTAVANILSYPPSQPDHQ